MHNVCMYHKKRVRDEKKQTKKKKNTGKDKKNTFVCDRATHETNVIEIQKKKQPKKRTK